MTHIWTPGMFQRAPDLTRCRHAVADGGRSPLFHQCDRKVKVWREVKGQQEPVGFCTTHDPERRAQRDAEERRAQEAEGTANTQRKKDGERRALALGVGGTHYEPSYGPRLGHYTGGVVLTADEADDLIARLQLHKNR